MKGKRKPAEASGIPVRCSFDEIADVSSLRANPKNPNRHPQKQLDVYAKVIRHQGWRRAVVVSRRSGLIVTGHGAVECARKAGWPQVPIEYQDFESDQDELAHLIADNQLPEMAEIDSGVLKGLESDLLGAGFDISLTGLELSPPAGGSLTIISAPKPPTRTWFLVGFPTVKMAYLQPMIDQIAALPDAYIRSTINDDQDGQREPGNKATPAN